MASFQPGAAPPRPSTPQLNAGGLASANDANSSFQSFINDDLLDQPQSFDSSSFSTHFSLAYDDPISYASPGSASGPDWASTGSTSGTAHAAVKAETGYDDMRLDPASDSHLFAHPPPSPWDLVSGAGLKHVEPHQLDPSIAPVPWSSSSSASNPTWSGAANGSESDPVSLSMADIAPAPSSIFSFRAGAGNASRRGAADDDDDDEDDEDEGSSDSAPRIGRLASPFTDDTTSSASVSSQSPREKRRRLESEETDSAASSRRPNLKASPKGTGNKGGESAKKSNKRKAPSMTPVPSYDGSASVEACSANESFASPSAASSSGVSNSNTNSTSSGNRLPVIDTSARHSSLFVPPDVSGLTKREARLVKNRAAAFLSRQRKREQFEELEIRVKAFHRAWAAAFDACSEGMEKWLEKEEEETRSLVREAIDAGRQGAGATTANVKKEKMDSLTATSSSPSPSRQAHMREIESLRAELHAIKQREAALQVELASLRSQRSSPASASGQSSSYTGATSETSFMPGAYAWSGAPAGAVKMEEGSITPPASTTSSSGKAAQPPDLRVETSSTSPSYAHSHSRSQQHGQHRRPADGMRAGAEDAMVSIPFPPPSPFVDDAENGKGVFASLFPDHSSSSAATAAMPSSSASPRSAPSFLGAGGMSSSEESAFLGSSPYPSPSPSTSHHSHHHRDGTSTIKSESAAARKGAGGVALMVILFSFALFGLPGGHQQQRAGAGGLGGSDGVARVDWGTESSSFSLGRVLSSTTLRRSRSRDRAASSSFSGDPSSLHPTSHLSDERDLAISPVSSDQTSASLASCTITDVPRDVADLLPVCSIDWPDAAAASNISSSAPSGANRPSGGSTPETRKAVAYYVPRNSNTDAPRPSTNTDLIPRTFEPVDWDRVSRELGLSLLSIDGPVSAPVGGSGGSSSREEENGAQPAALLFIAGPPVVELLDGGLAGGSLGDDDDVERGRSSDGQSEEKDGERMDVDVDDDMSRQRLRGDRDQDRCAAPEATKLTILLPAAPSCAPTRDEKKDEEGALAVNKVISPSPSPSPGPLSPSSASSDDTVRASDFASRAPSFSSHLPAQKRQPEQQADFGGDGPTNDNANGRSGAGRIPVFSPSRQHPFSSASSSERKPPANANKNDVLNFGLPRLAPLRSLLLADARRPSSSSSSVSAHPSAGTTSGGPAIGPELDSLLNGLNLPLDLSSSPSLSGAAGAEPLEYVKLQFSLTGSERLRGAELARWLRRSLGGGVGVGARQVVGAGDAVGREER